LKGENALQPTSGDVDQNGQAWLPGVPAPSCVRVADVCLRKLCQQFCAQCPPPTTHPMPSALDDLSFACLLLAVEWGKRSPETTSVELLACLDKVAGRFWGDRLPWRLALEFGRHNPCGVGGMDELIANLDHHNSSIRLWMMELAWCVRDDLDADKAVPRLLQNIAGTLGHWDAALGLCRALHPTDETFWISANAFKPKEDYAAQYRDRLDLARKQGLDVYQQYFELMELRLRRLIGATALGLTAADLQERKP
jgi:hypothetical protein